VPPEVEYHAAALDMLGVPADRHPLDDYDVTLPAAVAEWLEVGHLDDLAVLDERRLRVAKDAARAFYVVLDEGDDPPVYDEHGTVSARFSDFIFDLVSAGRLGGRHHLGASGPVPNAKALAWLGEQLRPGPVTRLDDVEIHRFYGRHEYATVRWTAGGSAEWRLEADSPEALDALRELVDRVAGVPARGLLRRLSRRKG
jgi:hypothetical protein